MVDDDFDYDEWYANDDADQGQTSCCTTCGQFYTQYGEETECPECRPTGEYWGG
jgi:hypothetical protein